MGDAPQKSKHRLTRRSFLSLSAAAIGGVGLYAAEISRHELSVEQHTATLPHLPDAFKGMRIAQISDIHFEEYTEPFFVREVVRHVNHLRPDLVLLTGDFVSYGPMPFSYSRRHMPLCAEILSGIQCPLRYASLGNHDCIINPKYVIGPLEEHGIPLLLNQSIPLERDGQRIWITGLGSACYNMSDPAKGIPKSAIKDNETVIVMAHEPDVLPNIARYNASLMLSGHTHGGQVRFPFLPPIHLPELGRIYVEGFFHYGPTQLYVNRGIGAVGVPFRFNCPPEITVFTLA